MIFLRAVVKCDELGCREQAEVEIRPTAGGPAGFPWKPVPLAGWRLPGTGDPVNAPTLCPKHNVTP